MSDDHKKKGGEEKGGKGKIPMFVPLLIASVVLVAGALFWFALSDTSPKKTASTDEQATSIAQVVCPSFSREHRYCTFNKNGTTSIGQEDGGTKLRFCFDLPYQSPENQHASYQLLYKDLRTGGFRDIRLAESGSVVTEMMFVGLDGDRPVTVGYNLAEQCNTGAATEDESTDEEEESESDDEEEEE
ncbi:MAG: hypothetical protein ABA06_00895 [Parcubacteria bacterium C7867-001]|nr:MAG: hypothetical protein ABA06_00895 [Parcubacteria bacterium C7867-001]